MLFGVETMVVVLLLLWWWLCLLSMPEHEQQLYSVLPVFTWSDQKRNERLEITRWLNNKQRDDLVALRVL
jgi:hypothetical protein